MNSIFKSCDDFIGELYETSIIYDKALELASISMINEYLLEKFTCNFFEDNIDKKNRISLKEFE